jgi:hypothetical protein
MVVKYAEVVTDEFYLTYLWARLNCTQHTAHAQTLVSHTDPQCPICEKISRVILRESITATAKMVRFVQR